MEFRQFNNGGGVMTGGHHDGGHYDGGGALWPRWK